MEVFACVDDNYGLMFNKRRQSRDRIVTDHILQDLSNRHICAVGVSHRRPAPVLTGWGRVLVIIKSKIPWDPVWLE